MQAKKDLARRIVADFHSAEAAAKAGEDWAKQFQKDEVPEDSWRRWKFAFARLSLASRQKRLAARPGVPLSLMQILPMRPGFQCA